MATLPNEIRFFFIRWINLLFQFGGLHRLHKQSVRSQIFLKLPGRLGFSLNCLVDESILYDG